MRLINADIIVNYQTYDDEYEEFQDHKSTIAVFLDTMTDEGCPEAVDAVPVRHGHWIERESGTEDKENGFATVIVCSCCDFPATTFYSEDCESRTQIRTDFCPNCGARMDGEGNGNETNRCGQI